MHNGAVQIRFRPGADQCAQRDDQRGEREKSGNDAAELRRGYVRIGKNESGERHGYVLVVNGVQKEAQPDDSEDEPEATAEFAFGGLKGHGRSPRFPTNVFRASQFTRDRVLFTSSHLASPREVLRLRRSAQNDRVAAEARLTERWRARYRRADLASLETGEWRFAPN